MNSSLSMPRGANAERAERATVSMAEAGRFWCAFVGRRKSQANQLFCQNYDFIESNSPLKLLNFTFRADLMFVNRCPFMVRKSMSMNGCPRALSVSEWTSKIEGVFAPLGTS